MTVSLRPYRPADLLALYDICLRTGDSGQDASALYQDPMLLGHFYAAPYATLYPEFAFVVTDDSSGQERAVGYVLGVPDSVQFSRRCEAEWFPLLRGLYPLELGPPGPPGTASQPNSEATQSPSASLINLIHQGIQPASESWLAQYPAHLHIDLLPQVQGGGWGRKLLETLFGALRAAGVQGVHLGVAADNLNAQQFYAHLGFQPLGNQDWGLNLGLKL